MPKTFPPLITDNGILAHVQGQWIAAASHMLPPPDKAPDDLMSSVIEEPYLGRIRVVHQRTLIRHGKHRHWAWLPVRADLEPPDAAA